MFHIGKVEKVILPKGKGIISADAIVQAMVRMWDDNLLLLEVDKKIANQLKEGDYAIADYSPVSPDSPHRRMLVTKILRGDTGKKIFKEFEKEHEKRKQKTESASAAPAAMPYIR